MEEWSNQVLGRGHQLVQSADDADIVVLNSCSVTAEADRKSRNLINRIYRANPQSRLVVTGCYASLQAQQVKTQLGVDLVISNQRKDSLVDDILDRYADLPSPGLEKAPSIDDNAIFQRGRQRAFIKIQDGCRYRCSFCIVTVARGEERSRRRQEIVDEVNRYHRQGIQEVVVTGVHVGGYGSDTGDDLYGLLSEILEKTTIPRIRLASVEPWDLPEGFFGLFRNPRLMPHMHLPLQSGSDRVLRRMARRCRTVQFNELVHKARAEVRGFNVTTDIIVGFPGETDADWNATMDFVEQAGFGHVHIFTYSPRAGTKAAGMPDQVNKAVKKSRSAQLHQLARQLTGDSMRRCIGNRYQVLWEHKTFESTREWVGYTPAYQRVTAASANELTGRISTVAVTGFDADRQFLTGELE